MLLCAQGVPHFCCRMNVSHIVPFPLRLCRSEQDTTHGICVADQKDRGFFAAACCFTCSAWRTPAWHSVKRKKHTLSSFPPHTHTNSASLGLQRVCAVVPQEHLFPLFTTSFRIPIVGWGVVQVSSLHVSSFLTYTWLSCIKSKMITFNVCMRNFSVAALLISIFLTHLERIQNSALGPME